MLQYIRHCLCCVATCLAAFPCQDGVRVIAANYETHVKNDTDSVTGDCRRFLGTRKNFQKDTFGS